MTDFKDSSIPAEVWMAIAVGVLLLFVLGVVYPATSARIPQVRRPFASRSDVFALSLGCLWFSKYLVSPQWFQVITSMVSFVLAALAWSTLRHSQKLGILQMRARISRSTSPRLFFFGLTVCAICGLTSLGAAVYFGLLAANR